VAAHASSGHSRTPVAGNESDQEDFYYSPKSRSPHAAQDWRTFDLIGIALALAQAQYPMGATLGGAK